MRDLAVAIVIFGLLPAILWRPYIGALTWAWLAFMIPHRLAFGWAHNFPFSQIVAITTLIALVLWKDRKPFPWGPIPKMLILFVVWMSVTSLFALAAPEVIFEAWLRVFKIHLMLLVTLMLIRGREQIEQLIWVIVLSLGYYGVKGGIWTVLRGGAERVWGPPGGAIEGNNELALALVMLVPLMYYLMSTTSRKLVKYALIFCMAACTASVFGSQSRGAFLAVVAAVGMLAVKSRRPVILGVFGVAALGAMAAFMPATWIDRMHTIDIVDEGTASQRMNTWRTLWNMALDRPIVGAGFETALPEIFQRYSPVEDILAYSAHSIYFQALGEHGFVGLFIYLTLLLITWRQASRVARLCRGKPGLEWGDLLMRMTQVSLLGFMVGGAFLGLLHFDFPYYLMALVVMVDAALKEKTDSPSGKPVLPASRIALGAAGAPQSSPAGWSANSIGGGPRRASNQSSATRSSDTSPTSAGSTK